MKNTLILSLLFITFFSSNVFAYNYNYDIYEGYGFSPNSAFSAFFGALIIAAIVYFGLFGEREVKGIIWLFICFYTALGLLMYFYQNQQYRLIGFLIIPPVIYSIYFTYFSPRGRILTDLKPPWHHNLPSIEEKIRKKELVVTKTQYPPIKKNKKKVIPMSDFDKYSHVINFIGWLIIGMGGGAMITYSIVLLVNI
tara:strand:+ start:856 stop:1443 length:588 start_codon:yes stop_codon:yes gene_type:complete